MPIVKHEDWEKWVDNNKDPYGGACITVAREVMRLLDLPEHSAPLGEDDTHALLCKADRDLNVGGITGFMAGCVARMVAHCHSRGEEFRKAWNGAYGVKPEEDKGGVVNPAVMTVG